MGGWQPVESNLMWKIASCWRVGVERSEWNNDAAPFEWTKSQVHQVGVTKNINNLRN